MNAAARKFGLATQRGLSASFHVLVAPARTPEHVFACRSRPHETTAVGEEIAPNWKFSAAIPLAKAPFAEANLPAAAKKSKTRFLTDYYEEKSGRARNRRSRRAAAGPPARGLYLSSPGGEETPVFQAHRRPY